MSEQNSTNMSLLHQVGIQLVCEDRTNGKKCLFPSLISNLNSDGRVNLHQLISGSVSASAFLQNHLLFIHEDEIDISLGIYPNETNKEYGALPIMIGRGFQIKIKHQSLNSKSDDQGNEDTIEVENELEEDNSDNNNENTQKSINLIKKGISKKQQPQQTSLQNIPMNNSTNKRKRQCSTKRSHERTIGESIQLVSQWRNTYEQSKNLSVVKDLSEIATQMNISKKTLDYYFLELRTAEFFKFDFDSHLDLRMGYLREFIEQQTAILSKNQPNLKIQRALNLKYQLPIDRVVKKLELPQKQETNLSQSLPIQLIHNENINGKIFESEDLQQQIKKSNSNYYDEENNNNHHNGNKSNNGSDNKSNNDITNSNNGNIGKDNNQSNNNNNNYQQKVNLFPFLKEQMIGEVEAKNETHLINEFKKDYHKTESKSLTLDQQNHPLDFFKGIQSELYEQNTTQENQHEEIKNEDKKEEYIHPLEKKMKNPMYIEFIKKAEESRQQRILEELLKESSFKIQFE